MNREQARVLSVLDGDEVKVIFPRFNPECIEFMKAFGRGEKVTSSDNSFEYFTFNDAAENYSIESKTYTINGIECIAPMSEKPKIGDKYWIFSSHDVMDMPFDDDPVDMNHFNQGNFFKTEEAAHQTLCAIAKILQSTRY